MRTGYGSKQRASSERPLSGLTNLAWYHPNGDQGDERGSPFLLPDTHAHLDAPVFAGHHDEIVERALAAGVDRILAVGSDLFSSETAVALARRFDSVYAAVGVHPHETAKFASHAAGVRALLGERKVVAVGEIGLDYYRGRDNAGAQMEAFREQLMWAREAHLPVSVHNRGADREIIDELRSAVVVAVLHCFTGTVELAREAIYDGHWVSFAGNVTFPKATVLRDTAVAIPPGRILVETDSPVLAPQPWRGQVNEPWHATATGRVLAVARGETYDAFCALVNENAERVFHWRQA